MKQRVGNLHALRERMQERRDGWVARGEGGRGGGLVGGDTIKEYKNSALRSVAYTSSAG